MPDLRPPSWWRGIRSLHLVAGGYTCLPLFFLTGGVHGYGGFLGLPMALSFIAGALLMMVEFVRARGGPLRGSWVSLLLLALPLAIDVVSWVIPGF